MTRASTARRLLVAVAWTVALAAALHGLDRFLLGPPVSGWQRTTDLEEIPPRAGAVATPAYLPEGMTWPPDPILHRAGDEPGWWLGIGPGAGPPVAWIGSGAPPAPDALGEARACVEGNDPERCPHPWRHVSGLVGDDVVHVVGRLPPEEMRRILAGLHPRR